MTPLQQLMFEARTGKIKDAREFVPERKIPNAPPQSNPMDRKLVRAGDLPSKSAWRQVEANVEINPIAAAYSLASRRKKIRRAFAMARILDEDFDKKPSHHPKKPAFDARSVNDAFRMVNWCLPDELVEPHQAKLRKVVAPQDPAIWKSPPAIGMRDAIKGAFLYK